MSFPGHNPIAFTPSVEGIWVSPVSTGGSSVMWLWVYSRGRSRATNDPSSEGSNQQQAVARQPQHNSDDGGVVTTVVVLQSVVMVYQSKLISAPA